MRILPARHVAAMAAVAQQVSEQRRELAVAILQAVGQEPGITKNRLYDAVGGNKAAFDTARDELVTKGRLRIETRRRAQHHYLTDPEDEVGGS